MINIKTNNSNNLHHVSYDAFRASLNNMHKSDRHHVIQHQQMTLVLNQHKQLIALINPPHINAYNSCVPIQYFVASTAQNISLSPYLLTYSALSSAKQNLFKTVKLAVRLFKQPFNYAPHAQHRGVSHRASASLWTTVRLTA